MSHAHPARRTTHTPGFPAAAWRWMLLCSLLLSACSTPASLYATKPAQELQWPARPGQPRIVWVRAIAEYQDLGIATGGWQRLKELLTGPEGHGIVRPHGVLFDSQERLIVADPGAGVVHCMDIKTGSYSVIGKAPGPSVGYPIGVAEDGRGQLYITDSSSATVFVYDLEHGTLKPFLHEGLQRPTGIAYSRADKLLYVVDSLANQVLAVDGLGHIQRRIGGLAESADLFNRPTDIAIDRSGQLYVTDPLDYRVKVFTPKGELVREIGAAGDMPGNLNKPKGIALDSEGHIYLADALLDVVQIFDQAGNLLLYFGANGKGNGEFWMPSGLFIDGNDYIFVSDTYNHRIQVFRYLADRNAVPGAPARTGDGPAPAPPTR